MHESQPAVRSYFFGPGYKQLSGTIRDAMAGNRDSMAAVNARVASLKASWSKKWVVIRIPLLFFVYLYKMVAKVVLYGLSSIFTLAMLLVHGGITFAVMCVVYVLFAVTWLVDRVYLLLHSINSSCPDCKVRMLIPTFECKRCGKKHTKLVPGVYGVWKRRCECGHKLPTHVLGGRSRLDSFCPACGHPLSASDAKQVAIQIVGGVSSGKTVLLSAFFHEFQEHCSRTPYIKLSMNEDNRRKFDNLERWFGGGGCPTTTDMNAEMYSLLVDSKLLSPRRQFSVYDIAGEMFQHATEDSVLAQVQYKYCDGIVLVIDPLSSSSLRDMQGGLSPEETRNYSRDEMDMVVHNYMTYLTDIGGVKTGQRMNIPVSVVISKADVRLVRHQVSPLHIRARIRKNGEMASDYQQVCDEMCRQFLRDIGMGSVLDAIDVAFSNVHFFPASAMGHIGQDQSAYEPWGVLEPFFSIIRHSDERFAEALKIQNPDYSK